MARPTSQEIVSFGPSTIPFGRNPKKKFEDYYKEAHWIKEDFKDKIHDAYQDKLPPYPEKAKLINNNDGKWVRELIADKEVNKEYCYLWVLENEGIKILYEGTPNFRDEENKIVKHTNITGGKEAYHGGEMFISKNNEIFIVNKSDRYGHPIDIKHWKAAVSYFQKTYYKYKVIDLTDLT